MSYRKRVNNRIIIIRILETRFSYFLRTTLNFRDFRNFFLTFFNVKKLILNVFFVILKFTIFKT